MLDKQKRRVDTLVTKEPAMAVKERVETVAEAEIAPVATESEIEHVAKSIAKDDRIRESLELSLADSKKGRVLTQAQAMKRLKNHAL